MCVHAGVRAFVFACVGASVHACVCSFVYVDKKDNMMPDSQSSEPGLESPFGTVSKIGYFRSLH